MPVDKPSGHNNGPHFPAPPLDWMPDGTAQSGRFRLRPTFFGVVLEELIVDRGGGGKWKRYRYPVSISNGRRWSEL